MSRTSDIEQCLEYFIERLENTDERDIEARREIVELIQEKQILLDFIEMSSDNNN